MAIRQFEFTVSDSGITPATEQRVSIQTEHAAAELCFTLHSDLFAKLNEEKENGKAVYRFDCYDSAGGSVKTESLELTENVVKLTVGESITRHGGKVAVYLVITVINSEGKTVLEFLSAPARLRIEQIPSTVSNNGESKESFSTLAEATRKYALEAKEAKSKAEDVKNELLASVDQSFKPESENAQSGKAVAEAISDKATYAEVASGFQSIQSDINKKAEKTEVDKLSEDLSSAESRINGVEENIDTVTEDVSGKMDKFGDYDESAKAIYVGKEFNIRSSYSGNQLAFHENGVGLATGGDFLKLHANNVTIELMQDRVNLIDASTYPEKPMSITGVKAPDGTDSTAAVNLEYLNGVVGDINSVLSQLVETEE